MPLVVRQGFGFLGPAVSSGCADAAGREVGCDDPGAVGSACFDAEGVRTACPDGPKPPPKPGEKKKKQTDAELPPPPKKPGVPWWAWLAGGVGVAAILVGAFGGRRR